MIFMKKENGKILKKEMTAVQDSEEGQKWKMVHVGESLGKGKKHGKA